MKLNKDQIFAKYDKAKGIKTSWNTKYDEVFDIVMPSRNGIYSKGTTNFEEKRETLFCSIGETSADEFVNRIQENVFPIGFNWISLEAGFRIDDKKKEEFNKGLKDMCGLMGELKNKSNFDTAITESLYDLVAGTFVLALIEGTPENPFNFVPIPIQDFTIEEGKQGEVAYTWRSLEMDADMIKHQWYEAENMDLSEYGKTEDGTEGKIQLLECAYKDYDTGKWIYAIYIQSDKKQIVEREMKSNPFICFRWTKSNNEVYGRGVGLKALRDLKTLNKILENSLTAQAFQLPIFMAQQDGMLDIDNIILEPGAIIPVPSTATGNPSVTALPVGGNFDIMTYGINDMIARIQKTMLASTLDTSGNAQKMTATEVAQRQSDLMISLGSVYGRLFSELYKPLISRMLEIAMKFELISEEKFPMENLDNFSVDIKINTPVMLSLKKREVMNTVGAVQLFQSFDPTGALIQATVDMPAMARKILLDMGVDPSLVHPANQSKANMADQQEGAKEALEDEKNADAKREIAVNDKKEEAKKV